MPSHYDVQPVNTRAYDFLCEAMALGHCVDLQKIDGGFSHRVYRLTTDRCSFAVKELGEATSHRQVEQIRLGNRLAIACRRVGIPAVPAVEFDGEICHSIDGVMYLVFPWIAHTHTRLEGNAAARLHRSVGELLYKIHLVGSSQIEDHLTRWVFPQPSISWTSLVQTATAMNVPWASAARQNAALLDMMTEAYLEHLRVNVSLVPVLSHGDLNERNLLRDTLGRPVGVVDWDTAQWVEPRSELITVAMLWSNEGGERIIRSRLEQVVAGYILAGGTIEFHPAMMFGYIGNKLRWLHLNMERSLVGAANLEDRRSASAHAAQTLRTLAALDSHLDEYLDWFREALKG